MHYRLSLIGRAATVAAVMAFAATASVDAIAGGPKHCPPGLAKKGSCTPPGHQKAWKKGDYIPADVEVRVIVNHDRVSDAEAEVLAIDISKKLQNEMQYPGQVKVTVIREARSVSYAK